MMSTIAAQEVRIQASPMETESLDAWEITGAIKEDVYRIDMCMFDCVLYTFKHDMILDILVLIWYDQVLLPLLSFS